MKQMYRGVRLKEYQKKDILQNGMRYYWDKPESAINDIFRAIKTHKIMKKITANGMLECRIMEGASVERNQIFGTEDKSVANSYARDTPELIYLTLDNGLVKKEIIQNYLNKTYGLPHIVTFNIDAEPTYHPEINKMVGDFIPPEFIVEVEEVDLTQPDPVHLKFGII